jgi:predicted DNA-binding ribbon-helix-helix protein
MEISMQPHDTSNNVEKRAPTISTLVSRNVTIASHRTSVRLEPEMWGGLSEICRRERASLHEICTSISLRKHENTSLTAAIRVFAMVYYRTAATEDGHIKAGHGYNNATIGMVPGNPVSMQRLSANSTPLSAASPYIMADNKMSNARRY